MQSQSSIRNLIRTLRYSVYCYYCYYYRIINNITI